MDIEFLDKLPPGRGSTGAPVWGPRFDQIIETGLGKWAKLGPFKTQSATSTVRKAWRRYRPGDGYSLEVTSFRPEGESDFFCFVKITPVEQPKKNRKKRPEEPDAERQIEAGFVCEYGCGESFQYESDRRRHHVRSHADEPHPADL